MSRFNDEIIDSSVGHKEQDEVIVYLVAYRARKGTSDLLTVVFPSTMVSLKV